MHVRKGGTGRWLFLGILGGCIPLAPDDSCADTAGPCLSDSLVNGSFDFDLSGWSIPSQMIGEWQAQSPGGHTGVATLTNTIWMSGRSGLGIEQCVEVVAGATYLAGAEGYAAPDQPENAVSKPTLFWANDAACLDLEALGLEVSLRCP